MRSDADLQLQRELCEARTAFLQLQRALNSYQMREQAELMRRLEEAEPATTDG